MLQVRNILLPTDYSSCAEYALTHAARFADALDARLHIIHVDERPDAHEEDFPYHLLPSVNRRQGIETFEMTVRWPSAKEAILKYAEAQDIDLIVMGTHGRHGLNVLMGSVAEAVARHAACPVLTVRPHRRAAEHVAVKRILVPIDLSERSQVGLRYGFAVARLFEAEVRVVHVVDRLPVPVGDGLDVPPIFPEPTLEATRLTVERMVHEEANGYPATTEVVIGYAQAEVLAQAKANDADLVVLSSHGRTGLSRVLLGSVAEKVIRHATCPVLTVKSFGRHVLREASADKVQTAS